MDTGLGSSATNPDAVATFAGGTDGRLLDELQAVGVRPEDVDTVFFTHLHPDHVGWNLSREGEAPRLTFPRARHLAHQADWDAFKKPRSTERSPSSSGRRPPDPWRPLESSTSYRESTP